VASPRRIRQAEYEALADFRYALRRFLRFSEAAAGAVGLTPRQHQALLAIRGAPPSSPLRVGDLAQRLQVRPHSAVGLLDRLVALGLVTRRVGRLDRRRVLVTLTARGRRVLDRLTAAHRAELRRLRPRITRLLDRLSDPPPGARGRVSPTARRSGPPTR
jgi:DNA-binding MarR family transcriptional regulator